MRAPNSSGVLAIGTKPSAASFSFTSGCATILAISLLQQVDDLLRRAGRHHDAGERVGFLILDALLGEGRQVGQRGDALLRRDAERAQLAVLHRRDRRRHAR